ncbi:alpha/beta hydrolase [Aneurinibacillus terranovensis]|uniref:alpha/beta hydrolase n=1 Tax=Aneurinibacillus terranovensis TaxID=278991 RepID=UPI00040576A5|nr:alpha/beta fold hydrolase [Aneurinibacillus terranovensis]
MKIKPRSPESFFYEGAQTGMLLIHGFTGSTAEMQPMGRFFQNQGYTVHAPLLAGHGTVPEEMKQTRWQDWWKSVLQGYDRLASFGCKRVFAAGLSMGGLLALRLTLHRPVDALISLNTPIEVRDKRIKWAKYVHYLRPFIPRGDKKEVHIEKEMFPYERFPLVCVASLWELIRVVKKEIGLVKTPVLVLQSQHDETIEPASARYIYSQIGADYKELKYYGNSGHILTLDREREQVFRDVHAFISRVIPEKK